MAIAVALNRHPRSSWSLAGSFFAASGLTAVLYAPVLLIGSAVLSPATFHGPPIGLLLLSTIIYGAPVYGPMSLIGFFTYRATAFEAGSPG